MLPRSAPSSCASATLCVAGIAQLSARLKGIHIEAALKARGKTPDQSDLAEMDALWDAAKAVEKAHG